MEVITSKSNDKVKFLKSLNDKKERIKNNCFYLEGVKVVSEILSMEKAVNIKFIAYSSTILKGVNGGECLLSKLINFDVKIIEFSKEIFEYICDTKTPQGIIAVIEIKEKTYNQMLENGDNILLLDSVQDPGNVGTIIRTCDAFNIRNVIYTTGTVDIYSPKTVRSTMSAICKVNFAKVLSNELDKFKIDSKKYGYTVIGTSLQTDNFFEGYEFENKNIIVFSNEANGISKEISSICDDLIKINMSQTAESLNVGIAAGIILHKLYSNNN